MGLLKTYIVPHPPIIIPEIGEGKEKQAQKILDAYHAIAEEIAAMDVDTVIVSSPHAPMYRDYFRISSGHAGWGSFERFGAPHVYFDIPYDMPLIQDLHESLAVHGIKGGSLERDNPPLDHGCMVPLYFLKKHMDSFNMIRLSITEEPLSTHYELGKAVAKIVNDSDRRVVWLASGDLSHKLKKDGPYGYAKEGETFDETMLEALKKANFEAFFNYDEGFLKAAAQCGLESFTMMAGALDGRKVKTDFHAYERPFGVGYAIVGYTPVDEDG